MNAFFTYAFFGSCLVAAAALIRGGKTERFDLSVALCISLFVLVIGIPHSLTYRLHPQTLDAFLYRTDLMLGVDPLQFCRFVQAHPTFHRLLSVVYLMLPLAFAAVYAGEQSRILLRAVLIGAAAAFVFYNLIPAAGPAYAFADFPRSALTVITEPRSARNCFPSMHLAWAILIAWNARHAALRIGAWSFALLTALATIGLGEHYYVDLVASLPFCAAVQWCSARFKVASKRQAEEELNRRLGAAIGNDPLQFDCRQD